MFTSMENVSLRALEVELRARGFAFDLNVVVTFLLEHEFFTLDDLRGLLCLGACRVVGRVVPSNAVTRFKVRG